ncbi:hypothetical protein KC357_g217 [Hortaea werneckii]|nr:hypothetical protein KC357_g217 [Hortaea werneckii]
MDIVRGERPAVGCSGLPILSERRPPATNSAYVSPVVERERGYHIFIFRKPHTHTNVPQIKLSYRSNPPPPPPPPPPPAPPLLLPPICCSPPNPLVAGPVVCRCCCCCWGGLGTVQVEFFVAAAADQSRLGPLALKPEDCCGGCAGLRGMEPVLVLVWLPVRVGWRGWEKALCGVREAKDERVWSGVMVLPACAPEQGTPQSFIRSSLPAAAGFRPETRVSKSASSPLLSPLLAPPLPTCCALLAPTPPTPTPPLPPPISCNFLHGQDLDSQELGIRHLAHLPKHLQRRHHDPGLLGLDPLQQRHHLLLHRELVQDNRTTTAPLPTLPLIRHADPIQIVVRLIVRIKRLKPPDLDRKTTRLSKHPGNNGEELVLDRAEIQHGQDDGQRAQRGVDEPMRRRGVEGEE